MSVWKIMLPKGVTEITIEYVKNNIPEATTDIIISEGIESIGQLAFIGLGKLKSVVIPMSVKYINQSVFMGTGITSLVIPNGVEIIHSFAFQGCKSLESVVIPNGITTIGFQIFNECRGLDGSETLKHIVLPDVCVIPENKNYLGLSQSKNCTRYSDFIKEFEVNNDLTKQSYSDKDILFLYQLQNIAYFRPSLGEILKNHPKIGVEDILHCDVTEKLHQDMNRKISTCVESLPEVPNEMKRKIISFLALEDLANEQSVESFDGNGLTKQGLFSKLCANCQNLKGKAMLCTAVLGIALGVYIQTNLKIQPAT